MPFSLYVAAGSTEMPEAEDWINKLKGAGVVITSNWPAAIKATGLIANPANSTQSQRYAWADQDKKEVKAATDLWILMPASPSQGAFWEFGYAHGLNHPTWISGGDQSKSIFTALADNIYADHQACFDAIVAYAGK